MIAVKRDLAVLLFGMLFPAVMTWLYFVQLAGDGGQPNSVVQSVMVFGKMFQFIFPLVFVWLAYPDQIAWPAFRMRGFALAVGFGVLTALATFGLYYGVLRDQLLASAAPAAIWQKLVELNCDTPVRFLLLATFVSLIHALLEEYYWRWFIFGWLRRHLALTPAIVIANLGFMAHHVIVLGVYFPGQFWTLAVPFSLAVAIGGAAWSWLYDHSQSLYGVWLSHVIVDAAIMVVGYDLLRGSAYW